MSNRRAFTLIELLVVVGIIALLSSIVLAALNSARAKGAEAAIRSNLRNMISAAELSYDAANPNSYSNACTPVASMISSIVNIGGRASCNSIDGKRWGASALINPIASKNWSVDSGGVVTWDSTNIAGGAQLSWNAAVAACAASGGRMPSVEQWKALRDAYNPVPPSYTPGFTTDNYWTSTESTSDNTKAYVVSPFGAAANVDKASIFYVRCVR